MAKLPYRAHTATGDRLDIAFPLHRETVSAVRVEQLVSTLLSAIDKDIAIADETSNGDVLQAVAMTLAIRAGMIHAPSETTERLAAQLLAGAFGAVADSERTSPPAGHA